MNSVHGGDVSRVSARTGIPVERILDFSANVNPLGLPARAMEQLAHDARDPHLLMQYPDPEASQLRHALSQRLHIPVESIVIGAGADALIHATVRALAPQRCLIPVPAFSEYERAARACSCPVHCTQAAQPGDLVVLNNPHNPTGACASRAEMLERIRVIRAAGATVLADEAFIDYVPEAAITRDAASIPGVVAVRSLTKFFGCPGLRVGYAVAAPETAAATRRSTLRMAGHYSRAQCTDSRPRRRAVHPGDAGKQPARTRPSCGSTRTLGLQAATARRELHPL